MKAEFAKSYRFETAADCILCDMKSEYHKESKPTDITHIAQRHFTCYISIDILVMTVENYLILIVLYFICLYFCSSIHMAIYIRHAICKMDEYLFIYITP